MINVVTTDGLSLDGMMQAPGRADEERRRGGMRRKTLVPLLLSALGLLAGSPVLGQDPTPHAAQLEAMKKLDLWVGEWKGAGWASFGGGPRVEFNLVERVERKVGGTVLFVEGRGTTKAGKEVAHDGIALVYFDDKAQRYQWHGHDLPWGTIDAEVKLVDGGFEWALSPHVGDGGATVRFTIRFDENRWREVGEISADGKSWNTFMEMTLERQKVSRGTR
ncbi:MAG: hypothetical protein HYR85_09860 [Planctomycetes bacterium]|nr:hypothetical protein [Planctomycetota bacterium]MBI3847230.1 hypothetical protein [Planctomycetota bacterium]